MLKVFLIRRLADALVLQCGGGLELVMHVSNRITDRTRDGLFDNLFLRRSASTGSYLCVLLCMYKPFFKTWQIGYFLRCSFCRSKEQ